MKLFETVRRYLNRYFEFKKYRNQPWMEEILNCQKEIKELDPHPYYLERYQKEELFYWFHIPKWIYEDSLKHRIVRCLDIGCGYGTLVLFCKKVFKCEVYCTDIVDTFLSKSLVDKYNIIFKVNNIELDSFPWKLNFDIIIFTEVLEHLNFHPIPTLKKIRNLLSENGRIYLSTPDGSKWKRITKYYNSYDKMPYPRKGLSLIDDHIYIYTENELFDILNASKLQVEKFGYSIGIMERHINLIVKGG